MTENKSTNIKRKKDEVKLDPKTQLTLLCQLLLNSNKEKYSDVEMEIKFGTRGIRHISKIDYDNVVKKIKSLGFTSNNETGYYSLKIQSEYLDPKTGEFKTSSDIDRFRVEIMGLNAIQEYCKNNDIKQLIEEHNVYVEIMRKMDVRVNDEILKSADFDDFNFRVSYKTEEQVSKRGKLGQEVITNWAKSKKIFRYMNRITFVHCNYPFKIDLSIVRTSTKEKWEFIKTFNVEDSNVFANPESYEIEIEVINDDAKHFYKTATEFVRGVQQITTFVLSGLQNTNFPISYTEQNSILEQYMALLHPEENKKNNEIEFKQQKRIYPNNFIGPSSVTLQLKNIGSNIENINVPNITKPYAYCVTEKADGIRHLLFINKIGKIYLINMNMNVIFTGAKTLNDLCFNSLLDGELILHNKNGKFINTFAVFDIYFSSSVDIRHHPFMNVPNKNNDKEFKDDCRLDLLKELINTLKAKPIIQKSDNKVVNVNPNNSVASLLARYSNRKGNMSIEDISPITIISKSFYPSYSSNVDNYSSSSIFEGCNIILQRIKSGLYDYNTDGLIFTPTMFGVGSNKYLEAGPLKKITWEYSFKWKPVEFNTIDFLISTKKGTDGNDIITPIFENGLNVNDNSQFNQYKTLILRVGFNEKIHGYINPCQDILDDKLPVFSETPDYNNNKPVQFFPTEPYNQHAGLCNIMLKQDSNMNYQMFTEESEVFNDETIVEFKYDTSLSGLWKWKPLRVRYDKTADYKQGGKNYGNSYTTANDNWYSIHNPITEEMISTGKNIPDILITDDVYYNSTTTEKITSSMRDFHNLFVKKRLIQSVSKAGNTLIDLSCGKGGDLPKWISANLSFIFGIDIAKNGIEHRLNGACARYLNYKKDIKNMPYALFVHGNSSLNIRSGKAMLNDKAVVITKAIFGTGVKNDDLGPAVLRQFGKGEDGFNVSSCQFAMHYMLENNVSFYNFIQNVAECTKLNGYFIGTCYDGVTVFNLLKNKSRGEGVEIYERDIKIWEIIKEYSSINFNEDETSLGYKINVFQDSINQYIPEYLVNFDFFVRIMENYGLVLITNDEAKNIGMPNGSGMFIELYNIMMEEIKRNSNKNKEYKNAVDLKPFEKNISFLNRYFIFKKIRNINAETLTRKFLSNTNEELSYENEGTKQAKKSVKTAEIAVKPKIKKLRNKILLKDATEALDTTDNDTNVNNIYVNETNVNETNVNNTNILKPKTKVGRKKKIVFEFED